MALVHRGASPGEELADSPLPGTVQGIGLESMPPTGRWTGSGHDERNVAVLGDACRRWRSSASSPGPSSGAGYPDLRSRSLRSRARVLRGTSMSPGRSPWWSSRPSGSIPPLPGSRWTAARQLRQQGGSGKREAISGESQEHQGVERADGGDVCSESLGRPPWEGGSWRRRLARKNCNDQHSKDLRIMDRGREIMGCLPHSGWRCGEDSDGERALVAC
jgi:hypothetical protein